MSLSNNNMTYDMMNKDLILVHLASASAALQSKETLQSFLICSFLLTRSSCLCRSLKWAKFEMDPSHSHESCHVTIPGQCREKFVMDHDLS